MARRAGLFSDGAARLVERYGQMDWPGLLDLQAEVELERRRLAADPATVHG
jgi:hypothetical protein